MANVKVESFNEMYGLTNLNRDWFRQPSDEEKEVKAQRIISGKSQSVWTDVVKRFFKNKWNLSFTILFLILIATVIIAPLASHYSESEKVSSAISNQVAFTKPGWMTGWNYKTDVEVTALIKTNQIPGIFYYTDASGVKNVISLVDIGNGQSRVTYENPLAVSTILGTDSIGRDVWTRLWTGAGWSLKLAFLVAIVETVIGVSLGIFVGFHVGKKVDTIVMRIIEIFSSVPGLLWMFLFALIMGTNFWSMALVLILVGWTGPVFSARMFTMKVKDAEFVKAAEASGVSRAGCLFKHILPNVLGRLLVSFVHRIPGVIFFETTLIFLGMPVGENGQATIGTLVQDARSSIAMELNLTYMMSIVGFLLVLMISLQIIANGLRDAFDPKVSA